MSCFYDFLSLTGLFPKVALIHNLLFEAIRANFSPFKSAKANLECYRGKQCLIQFFSFGLQKSRTTYKNIQKKPCKKF